MEKLNNIEAEESQHDGKVFSEICNFSTQSLSNTKIYGTSSDTTIAEDNITKPHQFYTEESPLVCKVCFEGFSDKVSFMKHCYDQTKGQAFICDECNRGFICKNELKSHDCNLSVEIEKPFSCNVCDKSFSQKHHFIEHYRIHTKEKPFSCEVCNKCFSRKYNLTNHYRVHTTEKRPSSKGKSFICIMCNKHFSDKRNLKVHYRIHTNEKPYSCDLCNRGFSSKFVLTMHKRTHTKEKPFSCDLCDKSFSQRVTLANHKFIHTKEKPFTCDVCNKSFSRKGTLKRHKLSHHSVKKPPISTT